MEPPSSRDPSILKDAMVGVYRSMPEADPAHYVRGQYDGYVKIDGVADSSTTETFAAMRLEVDTWRWAGVPFFIRTGKRLPVTQTEVRLVFRRPPRLRFYDVDWTPEPNQLVIKLDPTTGVRILAQAQRGTTMRPEPISLDMEFADEGGEGPTPYEVLLHAAIEGNSARFTRQVGVEEAWRVLEPLIDSPPTVHGYAPGSWGPSEADELLAGHGRWHEPWMGT
jgi:glucose-6-phosphate 1-dehydrogenase